MAGWCWVCEEGSEGGRCASSGWSEEGGLVVVVASTKNMHIGFQRAHNSHQRPHHSCRQHAIPAGLHSVESAQVSSVGMSTMPTLTRSDRVYSPIRQATLPSQLSLANRPLPESVLAPRPSHTADEPRPRPRPSFVIPTPPLSNHAKPPSSNSVEHGISPCRSSPHPPCYLR